MNDDVVIYQSSDGLVKMEAIVDASNETIWATQKAMAELFGVTVPNISYHFKRIFSSGELEPEMVIKEILITAQSGVRGLSEEKVKYYNLDAILSLGYRVNSVQATAFRKWATSILKQYMIKGYAVNQNAVSEQKYEDLKRALGLLENVFGQNLIMAEQQAKELFAVVKVNIITFVHPISMNDENYRSRSSDNNQGRKGLRHAARVWAVAGLVGISWREDRGRGVPAGGSCT